jgi:hypothetical protein
VRQTLPVDGGGILLVYRQVELRVKLAQHRTHNLRQPFEMLTTGMRVQKCPGIEAINEGDVLASRPNWRVRFKGPPPHTLNRLFVRNAGELCDYVAVPRRRILPPSCKKEAYQVPGSCWGRPLRLSDACNDTEATAKRGNTKARNLCSLVGLARREPQSLERLSDCISRSAPDLHIGRDS